MKWFPSTGFSVVLVFLAVASADAKLTRLAHFRTESLSSMSASGTAMALAVEQPLLGMMAMGGMQQAAERFFGMVDQDKPVYAVVYFKGDLPDLSVPGFEQGFQEILALSTNVAVAMMMPIVDTPEVFLKSKGAVDGGDGVFKQNDMMWWACKEGYAFMATDPEALEASVQELRRGIGVELSTMVVEMVVEKPLLSVYSESMQRFSSDSDMLADALSVISRYRPSRHDFSKIFSEYQEEQTKALAEFMGQVDRVAVGMNYDLIKGLSCEWFAQYGPGSQVARMLSSMSTLFEDLFSTIPAASPFFVAAGDFRDLTGGNELLLTYLREKWMPGVEDELIRETILDVLSECVWMNENMKSLVAFSDWDDAGRMVFVSNSQTRDNERAVDGGRKAMAGMMNLLKRYVPEQQFMTFDVDTMQGAVSFENLFGFITDKSGGALAPETMVMLLDVTDSVFGRTFEFSSGVYGDSIRETGKAAGAVYSVPDVSDSSAVADRIQALLPKASSIQPSQVGFISLGAMIKHLTPRVMKAAGVENAGVTAALNDLSTVEGSGTMAVSWNEGTKFRQVMNVSVTEFKGLIKFFNALSESQFVERDGNDLEATKAEEAVESECDSEEENVVESSSPED